jgi:hypothetical protein
MAITAFSGFRLSVSVGSDPAHGTTSGLFLDDLLEPTAPAWGRYLQNVFEMKDAAGNFSTRERGSFGIHYLNITSGAPDYTWIAADFAAVEAAVQAFWTAQASRISSDFRLVEHRWYQFGPGVVPPNPPVRITTLGTPILGSSSALYPHQVASTVTLRTPLRRHWGRFYVPATGMFGFAGGVGSSGTVDTFAGDARTMLTGPQASQGIVPVVWDRNRKRGYGVTAIEADSTPDIIRRRRIRSTGYKKIFTS